MQEKTVLESYSLESEGVPAVVSIVRAPYNLLDTYELSHVKIKAATQVVLDFLKEKIIERVHLKTSEILDPREAGNVKKKIATTAAAIVREELSEVDPQEERLLIGRIIQEMVGLGEIELLLVDPNLEEIVINSAKEPVRVYHKKYGWLDTNLFVKSEEQIQNYSSIIGRKVGREITNLSPLMDASLLTGSRVNSILYPISTKGNNITLRKFREDPWTIIDFINPNVNTLTSEVAALFWMAMQYEMSILVSGGTASGKTSFLNALLVFTPPNQRVVSIEDTREIALPSFLHWTPLLTRMPNPEGKGEVTMLDLMVNSLRMRPDRIVLGETRRQREAEVLFEAMHTGHSVYSTFHADEVMQVKNRLISPPIGLPEEMLSALQLVAVQYRQRRTGVRRTYEVAEFLPQEGGTGVNIVYKWDAREDKTIKVGEFIRVKNEITMHTGFSTREIDEDLAEKKRVLEYMCAQGIRDVESVGKVVAQYYRNRDLVLDVVQKNKDKQELL